MKDTVLLQFDLSKAEELEIDTALSDNRIDDLIKEMIQAKTLEIAKEYDKSVIKSAFLKAKLYDENCNPYTVSEHEKHKQIQKFCAWMLELIKENNLNKREIVKELERYLEK